MIYIKDIIDKIEKFCPKSYACDWDNVGLIIGNCENEVENVLVALDFDIGVAKEAKRVGAGLIITHHPIMFDPINKITTDTPVGRAIIFMIENNISLYSAHTNLDAAPGGINDYLTNLYGFTNSRHAGIESGKSYALARISLLPSPMTLKELADHIANKLNLKGIYYIGRDDALIRTAFTCSGSGGSFITPENSSLADVFITGDVKYSLARNSNDYGINIICAGHYETEWHVTEIFNNLLSDLPVNTIISQSNTNVFKNTGDFNG